VRRLCTLAQGASWRKGMFWTKERE
jgi:hypothetical protein